MAHRYPLLDFLRSLAILLVMLGHSVLAYGAPARLAPLQFGGTGVDLFFVLSGWLLGGQLLKEATATGQINIRRFWVRRWMRTLPAYYLVLFLTLVQLYATKPYFDFPWDYLVFVQNYDHSLTFFSVSWSLCVEEQFYLLIAPLIGFLLFFKRQTTTIVLMILLFLPSLFRHLGLYGHLEETHVRIDACVMGVFLAHVHYRYPGFWRGLCRYAPWLAATGLAAYLMFFIRRYLPGGWFISPTTLILSFVFGSWVILANSAVVRNQVSQVPGAYYIATRSYALYLLHPEMLALLKRFFPRMSFILFLCLTLAGSCLLAEVLYRCCEKPLMDAREKFNFSKALSGPHLPGSKQTAPNLSAPH